MSNKTSFRCAVYTRKSHEEGLDQDFNSLDAQGESCKAYIASQAGLGWTLREKSYDDGGISGGHMERPGLQALIKDIKAGLIDIIVVYKVDRLTRSLADFSKLVDVFDEHDVCFVSVTQAFNTTTSMGRLTLNVLLSFAQFEREVTAERIRDKIAASKAKGMWMGGTVPLGYRNADRKLYILEAEATTIRTIYDLYLTHKNVRLVQQKADERGLLTRARVQRSGKLTGGKPLTRGHIYRMLTNVIYIGRIQHKDKVYDGDHAAIIDQAVWDEVQSTLKHNAVKRSTVGNSKSPALLAGLLFEKDGNKLVPHHVNKKGHRYHYYVSQKLKTGDQDSGWRIPANTIEQTVKDSLLSLFSSNGQILELLKLENPSAEQLQNLSSQATALSEHMQASANQALKKSYVELIKAIHLYSDKITITFDAEHITERLNIENLSDAGMVLTLPMTIRRRGQEMKMVIGGVNMQTSNPDPSLIKLISRAHALRVSLQNGSVKSIKSFADQHNIDHADAKRMLPLGYLAPDIVEAILTGHQPSDVTASALKNGYDLPAAWSEQRLYLGFPA